MIPSQIVFKQKQIDTYINTLRNWLANGDQLFKVLWLALTIDLEVYIKAIHFYGMYNAG